MSSGAVSRSSYCPPRTDQTNAQIATPSSSRLMGIRNSRMAIGHFTGAGSGAIIAAGGCGCGLRRGASRRALTVTASDEARSEEHTSELQSLMRISYAVFCLKKKKLKVVQNTYDTTIYHYK